MASLDIPELDLVAYAREVLQQPDNDDAETYLDHRLVSRAAGLGLTVAFDDPVSPCSSKRNTTASAATTSATATTDSTATSTVDNVRALSTVSAGSAATALTTQSTDHKIENCNARVNTKPSANDMGGAAGLKPAVVLCHHAKSLTLSEYDKYLKQVDLSMETPRLLHESSPEPAGTVDASNVADATDVTDETNAVDTPGQNIWDVIVRRSIAIASLKRGLKSRMQFLRKPRKPLPLKILETGSLDQPSSQPAPRLPANMACICCRNDVDKTVAMFNLPCGHMYCGACLHMVVAQSITDNSKMPPRCCARPLPGAIIKAVLDRDEQLAFLSAVHIIRMTWELRVFCPRPACGKPIKSLPLRIDQGHPSSVVECGECGTRVCITCKQPAHPLYQDCSDDCKLRTVRRRREELEAEWLRSLQNRDGVEAAIWLEGATRKAQDRACNANNAAATTVAAAAAAAAAMFDAEQCDRADQCSRAVPEFLQLRRLQEAELERLQIFARKSRWILWSRHEAEKMAFADRRKGLRRKLVAGHAQKASGLEDRQIAAEMDLHATLEASEKSVRTRLKYMEAYCDGSGRCPPSPTGGDSHSDPTSPASSAPPATPSLPPRIVTENDLRVLRHQYNLCDSLEGLHTAKINVLREVQAKAMRELLERQESELSLFEYRTEEESESMAVRFASEQDVLAGWLKERGARMRGRWIVEVELLSWEIEKSTPQIEKAQERDGEKSEARCCKICSGSGIGLPQWPDDEDNLV